MVILTLRKVLSLLDRKKGSTLAVGRQKGSAKLHITQTDNTADIVNQNAKRTQIHDTKSEDIMNTLNKNATRDLEVSNHHIRTTQDTNNSKELTKHDQTSGKFKVLTKTSPSEEPDQTALQKHSTQHKTKISEHITVPWAVSGVFSTPQSFRGSRHFYCNPDQSQTTGGSPPSHFVNSVYIPSSPMLSAFNDRFVATALLLTYHFPIVRTHLVEFSTLSASCTQQGHFNNRIQINLNTPSKGLMS